METRNTIDSTMSIRKRGKRRKQPPKPLRDLIKKARADRALQAALHEDNDDEVLSSIESDQNEADFGEPKEWRALEEEMYSLQFDEDEGEVSWSLVQSENSISLVSDFMFLTS